MKRLNSKDLLAIRLMLLPNHFTEAHPRDKSISEILESLYEIVENNTDAIYAFQESNSARILLSHGHIPDKANIDDQEVSVVLCAQQISECLTFQIQPRHSNKTIANPIEHNIESDFQNTRDLLEGITEEDLQRRHKKHYSLEDGEENLRSSEAVFSLIREYCSLIKNQNTTPEEEHRLDTILALAEYDDGLSVLIDEATSLINYELGIGRGVSDNHLIPK